MVQNTAVQEEEEYPESEDEANPMADPAAVINAINQGIAALSNTIMDTIVAATSGTSCPTGWVIPQNSITSWCCKCIGPKSKGWMQVL